MLHKMAAEILEMFPGSEIISHIEWIDGVPHKDPDIEYRQLLKLAKEMGYRSGWASYRFREQFGYWPENRKETSG